MGKSVEDIHLQQRQGHGRITIRQILRGWSVMIRVGRNCCGIVYNGECGLSVLNSPFLLQL